jgi:hypothetical protein
MKRIFFSIVAITICATLFSQILHQQPELKNGRENLLLINEKIEILPPLKSQFVSTFFLLVAALNSLNSLNSVIKKETYRNKITSFNNPTSSEMGFNLEVEIQTAIKPILLKQNIQIITNPAGLNFFKFLFV